jgi:single-strand DNA-binding protein
MANFNKVILAGNLTRDPQLSYLPNNTPVCEFGLAINRKWKSQTGEMKDETTFVDCRAFARQAETISQYLSKGRPVLIEGRLRYEQWESKEGQKRSRLSVVVETFQFLGPPPEGGARPGAGRAGMDRGAPPPRSQEAYDPGPPAMDDGPPPAGGEEVPF